jgi:hypothetical protein
MGFSNILKPLNRITGSLLHQAERKALSLRPAKPDPDNAGGGMRSFGNQPSLAEGFSL